MSLASEARKKAGLTVKQAAKAARYTEATIRQYERPSAAISYLAALRLSRLYRCPMWFFLKEPNEPKKEPRTVTKSPRAEGRRQNA